MSPLLCTYPPELIFCDEVPYHAVISSLMLFLRSQVQLCRYLEKQTGVEVTYSKQQQEVMLLVLKVLECQFQSNTIPEGSNLQQKQKFLFLLKKHVITGLYGCLLVLYLKCNMEVAKQPIMVNCLVNRGRFLVSITNLSATSV